MDDLLDSAQKIIDDAAKGADPATASQPSTDVSAPAQPPAPPTQSDQPSPLASLPPEPTPTPPEPPVPAPTPVIPNESISPLVEHSVAPPPEQSPAATSEVVDTLLHQPPVAADTDSKSEEPPPTGGPPPLVVKKKKGGKGVLIATLLVLLLSLPLGVFFISNRQQLGDLRGRASLCCEGGVCVNGWTFGRDDNTPQDSCATRARVACDGSIPNTGSGGLQSGGEQCGGGGTTPPLGGSQKCPNGDQGQPGETCENLDKCDTAGGCNPACCDPARTPAGKVCDVPNTYCRSGKSSRDQGTGYHLTCVNNQCVNQLCSPGQASCSNDCTSHSQCQSSTTAAPTQPTANLCRYVNTGTSVSVVDCTGYTFRKLVFQCNGPLSLGDKSRCEDKGIHPGFESTVEDQTGATSVSLGSIPNCKSRQADLIVVGRPAGDTLTGDELPGTPRVANYVKADGSQSGCGGGGGGGGNPTPTPTPAPQCTAIKLYDTTGADITAAVGSGSRKLTLGETITLATPKGTATKAHFRIQGITDFTDNDTALTTATEYRLNIQIPTTLTQAQGNFEVEIFVGGQWK